MPYPRAPSAWSVALLRRTRGHAHPDQPGVVDADEVELRGVSRRADGQAGSSKGSARGRQHRFLADAARPAAGLAGRADVIEDLEAPFVELTELTPPPLEGLDGFGPVVECRRGPLAETDGHLAHVPCRDRVGDEDPARVRIDGEAHIRFGPAMDRLDDAAAHDPDVPQGEPEHVARLHRQESGGERSRAR